MAQNKSSIFGWDNSSDLGFLPPLIARRPLAYGTDGYSMWEDDYVDYLLEGNSCKGDPPKAGDGDGGGGGNGSGSKSPCDMLDWSGHLKGYNEGNTSAFLGRDLTTWGSITADSGTILYDDAWYTNVEGRSMRLLDESNDIVPDKFKADFKEKRESWKSAVQALTDFLAKTGKEGWDKYIESLEDQAARASAIEFLGNAILGALDPEVLILVVGAHALEFGLAQWVEKRENLVDLMKKLGKDDARKMLFDLVAKSYIEMSESFMDMWRKSAKDQRSDEGKAGGTPTSSASPCGNQTDNDALQGLKKAVDESIRKSFQPKPSREVDPLHPNPRRGG